MTFLFDSRAFGGLRLQTGHGGHRRAMRLAAPADEEDSSAARNPPHQQKAGAESKFPAHGGGM